jgi:hypothetical protein
VDPTNHRSEVRRCLSTRILSHLCMLSFYIVRKMKTMNATVPIAPENSSILTTCVTLVRET